MLEKFIDNQISGLAHIYSGGAEKKCVSSSGRCDTYEPESIRYNEDGSPSSGNIRDITYVDC